MSNIGSPTPSRQNLSLEKLQEEIYALEDKHETYEEELIAKSIEIDTLKAQAKTKDAAIKKLRQEKRDSERALASYKSRPDPAELEQARIRISELETALKDAEANYQDRHRDLAQGLRGILTTAQSLYDLASASGLGGTGGLTSNLSEAREPTDPVQSEQAKVDSPAASKPNSGGEDEPASGSDQGNLGSQAETKEAAKPPSPGRPTIFKHWAEIYGNKGHVAFDSVADHRGVDSESSALATIAPEDSSGPISTTGPQEVEQQSLAGTDTVTQDPASHSFDFGTWSRKRRKID
ncbi:MAG: hypothetical protein Q9196_004368 [Gyalolechia fulgens]